MGIACGKALTGAGRRRGAGLSDREALPGRIPRAGRRPLHRRLQTRALSWSSPGAGGSLCDARHRTPPAPGPPAVPVVAIILVGRQLLLDLPVRLPHPPAEALDLAAERAPEGGEIRLHPSRPRRRSGPALRQGAPSPPGAARPRGGADAGAGDAGNREAGNREAGKGDGRGRMQGPRMQGRRMQGRRMREWGTQQQRRMRGRRMQEWGMREWGPRGRREPLQHHGEGRPGPGSERRAPVTSAKTPSFIHFFK